MTGPILADSSWFNRQDCCRTYENDRNTWSFVELTSNGKGVPGQNPILSTTRKCVYRGLNYQHPLKTG